MKPFMRQKVTINIPALDSKGQPIYDRYGKPKTTKKTYRASVRSKANLILTKDGTERNTNIEIDVDSDVVFNQGDTVEYTRINGSVGTGTIVSEEEAVNLSHSKVWFRTFFVDGR